jgi:hypothetical protein
MKRNNWNRNVVMSRINGGEKDSLRDGAPHRALWRRMNVNLSPEILQQTWTAPIAARRPSRAGSSGWYGSLGGSNAITGLAATRRHQRNYPFCRRLYATARHLYFPG